MEPRRRIRAWRTVTVFVFVAVLTLFAYTLHQQSAALAAHGGPDVIVVLAGGVDSLGRPHCTVGERLALAKASSRIHGGTPVLLNGGGTTWKPRWLDANGYAIPEAALMALMLNDTGVELYTEGYSDDTIGNAFFARTMHTDLRPDWRRLLIITSEFQMARTKVIYDWVFGLAPLPHGRGYSLEYEAAPDTCLDETVLAMRRRKEVDGLQKLVNGRLTAKITTLAAMHHFVYQQHSGYTAAGAVSKKPLDSRLAETY